MSITDMNFDTLFEDRVCESLLKPLSVNCTIGMSFRDGSNDESAIALCVHFDFQPIFVDLTAKQVNICAVMFNRCSGDT